MYVYIYIYIYEYITYITYIHAHKYICEFNNLMEKLSTHTHIYIYIYIYNFFIFLFFVGPLRERVNISKWIGPQRDLFCYLIHFMLTNAAQSARAVEYTDCFSEEG